MTEEETKTSIPYEESLHYCLLQVQNEIENPPALGVGQYQHKYAKLEDILNAVRPLLSKHGLVLHQSTACKQDTNDAYLFTSVRSKHGESISSTIPLGSVDYDNDRFIHKLGSRITYLRRYELCSLLNIRHQDDDDGETDANTSSVSNVNRPPVIKRSSNGKSASDGKLSNKQQEAMQSLLMAVSNHDDFGTDVVDKIMNSWGITHVSECPADKYLARMQQIDTYLSKRGYNTSLISGQYTISKRLPNETVLQ